MHCDSQKAVFYSATSVVQVASQGAVQSPTQPAATPGLPTAPVEAANTGGGLFVQFQAVFEAIPASYLTLPQVDIIQSSISAAITAWVSPISATINIAQINSAAAAPSATAAAGATSGSGRRHILQTLQTFQPTLSFIITFTSQPASSADSAILTADTTAAIALAAAPLAVATNLTPELSGRSLALNASVRYPPDNTVSATPSQATLAAVTLANALKADAAQVLPSLVAKDGPVNVTGVALQVALVPAGPPTTTPVSFPTPRPLTIPAGSSPSSPTGESP